MNDATTWDEFADLAQRSLDHYFAAPEPQLLHNTYPAGDDSTFNYWWLAHVIDVRVDAYLRTHDPEWLARADHVHRNILQRNGDSLFNDYFDDMLWHALALLRLHRAGGEPEYLESSRALWEHVVAHGWNDHLGGSVAWRKQQPYYKNTPSNGPFVILSARLSAYDNDHRRLGYGIAAFDWLTATLARADGFIEDGINREQDGRIDEHWRFTYNQGLYVGAAVALAEATGDDRYLPRAVRTAIAAIDSLSQDGIFDAEGSGGDEGLFKGVYYRYLGNLLDRLEPGSQEYTTLATFVRAGSDALRGGAVRDGWLLAGDNWTEPAPPLVSYSTQLSAIMALEVRATMESASSVAGDSI